VAKTAFLFPGQGGQFVGMGAQWAKDRRRVAELFALADQAAGLPVTRLCFEGPPEELGRTANLQPAVLAVGLAAWTMATEDGACPSFAAGHSLGEFGALVAAGVLAPEAALRLVAKRAALMDAQAQKSPGSMTAVLNLPAAEVEAVCELARHEGLVVAANFNAPLQTVISGEGRAVAAATRFAEMKGGKAVPLPVAGAFHSPLMAPAAEAFAKEIEAAAFAEPAFPVVPNALGKPVSEAARLKELLLAQMTSPVLFTATVASLAGAGVGEYVECWPKPYLGPMVRKSLPADSPKAVIRTAVK
jgi:[acyl-carrier-protein] S-malonyltransferase